MTRALAVTPCRMWAPATVLLLLSVLLCGALAAGAPPPRRPTAVPEAGPQPGLQAPVTIRSRWTSFVDTRHVADLALDGTQVWTVGGGVKRYDLETGQSTVYRSEHGLASNDTRSVALDGEWVWVATAGGLSRYSKADGTWKSYYTDDGLVDDMLVSMALDDQSHVLWLGTWDSGVSAYDPLQERWRSYGVDDGLTENCVPAIAIDHVSGAVLFGTWGGGISRLDLASGTLGAWAESLHLATAAVSAIAVTDEAIWIGTVAAGLHRFDRQRRAWEPLPHAPGVEVSRILPDAHGGIWVGSREGGLIRYRNDTGSWDRVVEIPGAAERRRGGDALTGVAAIASQADGSLVFGTWGQGVVVYEPDSGRTRTLPAGNEISHNRIVSAALDERSGRLWFGSEGGGAASYDPTSARWDRFDSVMIREQDRVVNDFASSGDGRAEDLVWIATIDGVAALGNPATQLLRKPRRRDLKDALVESLSLDRSGGVLWAGTHNQGLYRLDLRGDTWRPVEDIPAHIFFDIAWDPESRVLWCGTRLGVVGYDPVHRSVVTAPSFPAMEIRSILVDPRRRTVWAGSWDSGLFRYDLRSRRWTQFTTADGLPGEAVVGLAIDDREPGREALWIGTNHGAGRYDLVTGEWQSFHARDGLAHDFILAVVVDRRGAVWFGTWGGGVSRYDAH